MSAFINELHYDNASTDVGEFVEIAAPVGTDLSGWSLVFYNGSNGTVYNTVDLPDQVVTDSGNGFGFVTVNVEGIQNGSPDGLALVDASGSVREFLSYEGVLSAVDGPAAGLTSIDIGVAETSTTPAGFSLQRAGLGTAASDFTFVAAAAGTPGAINTDQSFGEPPVVLPPLVINEFLADPDGSVAFGDANGDGVRDSVDDEFIEIVNAGSEDVDLSGMTLSDSVTLRHTFADGTSLASGAAIVVFGGGTPVGTFGGAQVVTASGGQLGLNNSGDTITLALASGEAVTTITYDGAASNNQSLTRDPDLSGDLVLHSTATGAGGALFSPGTTNDGAAFDAEPDPLSLVINEVHGDPDGTLAGDANGDGVRDSGDDEFVEIVNTGASDADLSGLTLSDGFGMRHSFADGTLLAAGAAIVVFGGGTPTGAFGGAIVQTASSGSLGLNNSGDTVTLAAADGTVLDAVIYGGEGGDNQSLTRDPGLTGDLVKHTEADGSNGALFSPGTTSSGDDFVPQPAVFTINEIDSDQSGTDTEEFVELYDGGTGNASLDGMFLALFNGNGDAAYDIIDLSGFTTNADGYFVIGSDLVENVDLAAFGTNGLQNGADAVALYQGGTTADYTTATTTNLVDAVVYGTNDSEDAGLLAALGQTVQYNEAETNSLTDALARTPDGSGGFVTQAPTPGASNVIIEPPELVLISQIQGSSDFSSLPDLARVGVDDRSVLEGQTVRIQAVVTADFQSALSGAPGTDLNGFFVQEEDSDQDGDMFTSEGLFIFDDFVDGNPDVQVGDLVEVTGTVSEFFGETQISASAIEILASNQTLPTATVVTLGDQGVMVDQDDDFVANLEAYEGMLVTLPQTLSVTELFQLGRFGTFKASADGRLEQFTQNNAPDEAAYQQHLQDIAARTITLDDGSREQNPDEIHLPDGNDGLLSAQDSFRMGDTLTNVTGVLSYSEDFQSGSEEPEFRIHLPTADYEATNPRPETPEDVGGNFKVASLNVLNYFTTLDDGTSSAGPDDDQGGRGADDLSRFGVEPADAEFERQANKIVQAIVEIDADVLGLVELENDDDIAIADLVARVNAALGAEIYDFVPTGDFGDDAITVGMIYKTASTAPLGDSAGLFEFDGRNFLDPLDAGRDLNRPALAQTFQDLSSGETLTVAVNHLKSKGSLSGLAADEDQGDGQGNNNATRTEAANILADWLASDPTGQGSENTLIIGDLNAYAQEDPITALESAGYTDLADELIEDASSFVFDGQAGTLDYALANEALTAKVTGVTEWRINSDEAVVTDYNLDFGRDPLLYNADSASRNSDHDPVIVGFNFVSEITGTAKRDRLTGTEFDDLMDGLGRRDVYEGRGGSDTFVMGDGDRDKIRDFSFEEGDIIDLTAWGVQGFEELDIFGHGRTVKLWDSISGNSARVRLDDAGASKSGFSADNFIFAPVTDLVLTGGRGFDYLQGRRGDDVFDGGRGFNVLEGGGGADSFVLNGRSVNYVKDFEIGVDLIDVSAAGITGFEDLHVRDLFGIARVQADHGRMLLAGISGSDLDADDFVFADISFG